MGPADFLNFPLEGGGNLQFKQKNTYSPPPPPPQKK